MSRVGRLKALCVFCLVGGLFACDNQNGLGSAGASMKEKELKLLHNMVKDHEIRHGGPPESLSQVDGIDQVELKLHKFHYSVTRSGWRLVHKGKDQKLNTQDDWCLDEGMSRCKR